MIFKQVKTFVKFLFNHVIPIVEAKNHFTACEIQEATATKEIWLPC